MTWLPYNKSKFSGGATCCEFHVCTHACKVAGALWLCAADFDVYHLGKTGKTMAAHAVAKVPSDDDSLYGVAAASSATARFVFRIRQFA